MTYLILRSVRRTRLEGRTMLLQPPLCFLPILSQALRMRDFRGPIKASEQIPGPSRHFRSPWRGSRRLRSGPLRLRLRAYRDGDLGLVRRTGAGRPAGRVRHIIRADPLDRHRASWVGRGADLAVRRRWGPRRAAGRRPAPPPRPARVQAKCRGSAALLVPGHAFGPRHPPHYGRRTSRRRLRGLDRRDHVRHRQRAVFQTFSRVTQALTITAYLATGIIKAGTAWLFAVVVPAMLIPTL